ncbi:MAG: hypothetical protein LZ168_01030 [Thaumarchaeota archaeon]|jgi:hypothetical protein|nr:hypothetical protein [Candidatus Geocrenenecus arthurdayi]MCL7390025.1 hypothetical protein [Candidatus Geocrenenecus arthurdayi]MCL7396141.1 hypothetical protein [Candidatus Geocrenenecus arthurdayi]MCL7401359.1 hypothetical protein [Candidatus Geocrenenecus arthurdayi]
MRARLILLIILTSILIYLLFSQNFTINIFIHEDEFFPRPIVEVELYCKNGKVKIVNNARIDGCLDGTILEFSVKLINNSSEPSLRGYDLSAGVLLIIDGGEIVEYNISDFKHIIGISSELEVTRPLNVCMVEVFTDYISGGEAKQSYFKIKIKENRGLVKISFRGWIIDEDKKVYNPVTEEEEHYVARYPFEDYEENPPDMRWAGREFIKYKVYVIEVT